MRDKILIVDDWYSLLLKETLVKYLQVPEETIITVSTKHQLDLLLMQDELLMHRVGLILLDHDLGSITGEILLTDTLAKIQGFVRSEIVIMGISAKYSPQAYTDVKVDLKSRSLKELIEANEVPDALRIFLRGTEEPTNDNTTFQ